MRRASGIALAAALLLSASAAGASPAEAGDAERSLDAITIEGVVDSPEVLFINAREPVRPRAEFGWQLLAEAGLLAVRLPPPIELTATPPEADIASEATPSEE